MYDGYNMDFAKDIQEIIIKGSSIAFKVIPFPFLNTCTFCIG